jgi:hypothetical protein
MDFNCKLEIWTDKKAVYQDNYFHFDDKEVTATVGGDELMLRTVERLNYWVEKYGHYCYREELVILGLHLYNIAFGTPNSLPGSTDQPWPLKDAFERTYRRFEEEKKNDSSTRLRLKLVLHKEAARLSAYPWEFIFMPKDEVGFFLAGEETELILTRFVPGADPMPAFPTDNESEKLRILIVLARPKELGIVRADDLIKQLSELQPQQIIVERCDQPTRRTLSKQIKDYKPHIMHFIGHGKENGLALLKEEAVNNEEEFIRKMDDENEARRAAGQEPLPKEYADWLDSKSVNGLFDDYQPRLVFLHACEGAAPYLLRRSLQSFSSTALELAYTKIPAVIAMRYEIANDDAERFARTFYSEIRKGKHIDEAVVIARRELGKYSSTGRQEWDDRTFGTPVIYLQSEKPIIRPPLLEGGTGPGSTSPVQKIPCPYADCLNGMIIPGRGGFCSTCRRPLMLCPQCQQVMAQAEGFCINCGYEAGRSAPPAQAAASQPAATTAAAVRPTQLPDSRDDMLVTGDHQTPTE